MATALVASHAGYAVGMAQQVGVFVFDILKNGNYKEISPLQSGNDTVDAKMTMGDKVAHGKHKGPRAIVKENDRWLCPIYTLKPCFEGEFTGSIGQGHEEKKS